MIEVGRSISRAELIAQQAYYALAPEDSVVDQLSKILAFLHRDREWEDHRPVESRVHDNRFSQINLKAARRAVAQQFAAAAGLLASVFKKDKK